MEEQEKQEKQEKENKMISQEVNEHVEEKIKKIIKKVIEDGNCILFIDEIHNIIKAGGAEGAIDASNILKPYLSRNQIQVIGATTEDEFQTIFEKDKALNLLNS